MKTMSYGCWPSNTSKRAAETKSLISCVRPPDLERSSRSRKPRPRSSPVRYIDSNEAPKIDGMLSPAEYLRSPSLSPVRFSPTPSRHHTPDFTEERIYANSGSEAYYSSTPPATPVRLVFVQSHDGRPKYQDAYKKDNENEYMSLCQHECQHFHCNFGQIHNALNAHQPREPRRILKSSGSSKKAIRLLVLEIVAKLPLPSSNTKINLSIGGKNKSTRCNIAVQAHKISSSNNMATIDEGDTEGSPEEWVGGVRALRDSHVRLVLRQLKHIDRLNRTLDRAARPYHSPNTGNPMQANYKK